MVSGALGSAVFWVLTGVLLTRRYPLVDEGVRCSARSQRIFTREGRLASGGRMVHHSIAVSITSFLTNFLDLRQSEVRRILLPKLSEKSPRCPKRCPLGPHWTRFGLV